MTKTIQARLIVHWEQLDCHRSAKDVALALLSMPGIYSFGLQAESRCRAEFYISAADFHVLGKVSRLDVIDAVESALGMPGKTSSCLLTGGRPPSSATLSEVTTNGSNAQPREQS